MIFELIFGIFGGGGRIENCLFLVCLEGVFSRFCCFPSNRCQFFQGFCSKQICCVLMRARLKPHQDGSRKKVWLFHARGISFEETQVR